jgi:hypothetical protein
MILSLAFGDRLTVVCVETWHASGLGQALGFWVAVLGRAGRRMNGLQRLAALLSGIAFCTLTSHFRVTGFLEGALLYLVTISAT